MIGMTKITLQRVLGLAQITLDRLHTIVAEVESVLIWPIKYISMDISVAEPLTPFHLLYEWKLEVNARLMCQRDILNYWTR